MRGILLASVLLVSLLPSVAAFNVETLGGAKCNPDDAGGKGVAGGWVAPVGVIYEDGAIQQFTWDGGLNANAAPFIFTGEWTRICANVHVPDAPDVPTLPREVHVASYVQEALDGLLTTS